MGGDLIDTTEMYLKTIYELEEDNVEPMRARIVERLGHSGPTVSQTIARMERDGLVEVADNRRLVLSPEGWKRATEVIRKHRLAELLLLHVIRMPLPLIHSEACRWEHVMSDTVDKYLFDLLDSVEKDPFGNLIPEAGQESMKNLDQPGIQFEEFVATDHPKVGRIARIGEPLQANADVLQILLDANILPDVEVEISGDVGTYVLHSDKGSLPVSEFLARHIFMYEN
ncbi:metal-dependent transcriptional regulator [Boudabousia marimammalium]|uniref:HTH dtxR-type domain-containing protein n=1 Tax=Boudabousia marimammalium TaxID=156892 RepID=A0A1Q5PL59_9ACTO|nr:metal-dependent transcriptional regulator [Boudabousia marimammalium]OKL47373.1 hypothetical protein BM477_06825 [Boudabousia marimammalium]